MTGIRSRRSLLKSTIRVIRELLVIWLWIFERDGRVSTSSHQKCSVLVIGAEERRFWGINIFITTSGFSFVGYCSFWLQKRWTLMPKKLRIYRLRNTALLTIVRYVATGPQWIFVDCRLVVLQVNFELSNSCVAERFDANSLTLSHTCVADRFMRIYSLSISWLCRPIWYDFVDCVDVLLAICIVDSYSLVDIS